jgi:hypothetical protein
MLFAGIDMKCFVGPLLVILLLPAAAWATEITLEEDGELLTIDDRPIMTIEAGEKFSYQSTDGKWVYGWYMHDDGVARGKVLADVFKEQAFLRRESDATAGEAAEEEFGEVEEPFGEEAVIEEPEGDPEPDDGDDEEGEEEEKGFLSIEKLMEYKLPIMIGAAVVLVLVLVLLLKKRSKE